MPKELDESHNDLDARLREAAILKKVDLFRAIGIDSSAGKGSIQCLGEIEENSKINLT
jgi:hypothetical protein